VDLVDGGEVQAEHRIHHHQHTAAARQLACEHGPLHVAARQRADRRIRPAGLHAERLDAGPRRGHHPRGAQPARPGERGDVELAQRQVLGDRHRGHAGVAQRLLRQAADTVPRDLAASAAIALAADPDRARGRLALPQQGLDQFALSVARDPGDAEDLAGAHRQRRLAHHAPTGVVGHGQPLDGEHRRRGLRDRTALGQLAAARGADHRVGQPYRVERRDRPGGDPAAAPQHGHVVGEGRHLAELVGDHHDGQTPGMRERTDRPEHLVGLVGCEHRGRLVEDQQPVVRVELLEDLGLLLLAGGEVRDRHLQRQRERRAVHEGPHLGDLGGPVDDRAQPAAREREVLGDRHRRHQREVLIDHADAERTGGLRRADVALAAVEQHRPRIGALEAHQALDQRRLARAVLAQQRVDRARPHVEVDRIERDEVAEPLGQPDRLQRRCLHLAPAVDGPSPSAASTCSARPTAPNTPPCIVTILIAA